MSPVPACHRRHTNSPIQIVHTSVHRSVQYIRTQVHLQSLVTASPPIGKLSEATPEALLVHRTGENARSGQLVPHGPDSSTDDDLLPQHSSNCTWTAPLQCGYPWLSLHSSPPLIHFPRLPPHPFGRQNQWATHPVVCTCNLDPRRIFSTHTTAARTLPHVPLCDGVSLRAALRLVKVMGGEAKYVFVAG